MAVRTFINFVILSLLASSLLFAQKGPRNNHLEIKPQQSRYFQSIPKNNLAQTKSYPTALHNVAYKSLAATPEEIARGYLKKNGFKLGISDVQGTLVHSSTSEMRGGFRVRFKQVYEKYPVYKSSVVVSINRANTVVFVANSYKPGISLNPEILISEQEALQISMNHLAADGELNFLKNELVVFNFNGVSRLVRHVSFMPQGKNSGDWSFLIDAQSGEIIQAKDQAFYYQSKQPASGFGQVFNPDPITRSGATYGDDGFVDNNDGDSDSLTAQRVIVPLQEITLTGSLYSLNSAYASIVDVEAPFTGLHEQDSSNFFFTRSQNGFEATNVFYHIDRSMRYINDTLGVNVMPYHYEGGVRFDPHGLEGGDNSWYVGSQGYVAFGDGGVADGEDQDVIIHELGHGLHDWLTQGGLSQVDGLSEGSSDYWAQSYKRAKGFFSPSHPMYNWVFSWDGHNPFWAGRTSGYGAKYPSGLVGQIHTDGQIWATSLMKIYDRVGKFSTDVNFLDGLSMLNENSSQRDAAFAFIQSDRDNFNGQHLDDIIEVFSETGYVTDPVTVFFTADTTGGPAGLTVNFSDQSFAYPDTITSWAWDFDNDGVVDSNAKNPQYTYTKPGLYTVTLTASDGINTSTDSLVDYISVNAGLFVWEGIKGGNDNSGRYIFDKLKNFGIDAVYSRSEKLPSSLIGYDAVFLSFGNGHGNYANFNDAMAATLIEYLEQGGNVYLEGGDALGRNQAGNSQLLSLLGVQSAENGSSNDKPVSNLIGQPLSVFSGISFTGSAQSANASIDRFQADGNGTIAFIEAGYGNVAVQSAGAFGQRAVVFSYALAGLEDGNLPNTREDILGSLLKYFGIPLPIRPRFSVDLKSGHAPLIVQFTDFSFYDSSNVPLLWRWDYNNDGLVESDEKNPEFTFKIPGRYDVKLTLKNGSVETDTVIHDFVRIFNGESALNFDAEENYVEIVSDSALNISKAFTLEFWMNPASWGESSNGYGRIFDKGNLRIYLRKPKAGKYNAESLIINMRHEGGKTSTYGTPDSSITLNTWQHIVIAYDSANDSLRVFINGEMVPLNAIIGKTAGPVLDNTFTPLIFGDAITKTRSYSGALDEIRLWSIARPSGLIEKYWNRYVLPEEVGLTAYWQFNEANGDTLINLTTKRHYGLITNADWVEGKPDLLPTGIKKEKANIIVNKFILSQNYPNPFNPETVINYELGITNKVKLIVYDVLGRKVKTLVDKTQPAGKYTITFNAANLASGVYYYKLEIANKFVSTRKMLLLK